MASKKVVLKSSDGVSFDVDEAVACESLTIAKMLEDGRCMENGVPLPNVTSETLAKVIQYCKKHVEAVDEELKTWDAEFIKMDESMLSKLMQAAYFLEIEKLFDLTCETADEMIGGKIRDKIHKGINPFNNQWALR